MQWIADSHSRTITYIITKLDNVNKWATKYLIYREMSGTKSSFLIIFIYSVLAQNSLGFSPVVFSEYYNLIYVYLLNHLDFTLQLVYWYKYCIWIWFLFKAMKFDSLSSIISYFYYSNSPGRWRGPTRGKTEQDKCCPLHLCQVLQWLLQHLVEPWITRALCHWLLGWQLASCVWQCHPYHS